VRPRLMSPAPTKVEHGDLNWIVPNKLVAFSGPANRPSDYGPGYRALVPEDYWEYYRRKRVTTVVRLNKKVRPLGQPALLMHPPLLLPARGVAATPSCGYTSLLAV
jgi:hypothetical protein